GRNRRVASARMGALAIGGGRSRLRDRGADAAEETRVPGQDARWRSSWSTPATRRRRSAGSSACRGLRSVTGCGGVNARKPCKSGRERIGGSTPAASMIGLIPGVCGKERRGGSGDPGQATYRPFAREKGDLAYASATPSSRGSIVLRQRGRINDQDRSSCAA